MYRAQQQKQNQVLDQNYANGTLFMVMSTLETLQQKYRGERRPKQFGAYDKVDYFYKPIPDLISQTITQLMLLHISRQKFDEQYGKNQYKLPKSYDQQKVLVRLQQYWSFFQSIQNDSYSVKCRLLVEDFINILNQNFTILHYGTMQVQPQLEQKNNNYVKNVISSTNFMHEEGDKIRSKGQSFRTGDLEFEQNPDYKPQNQSNMDIEEDKKVQNGKLVLIQNDQEEKQKSGKNSYGQKKGKGHL